MQTSLAYLVDRSRLRANELKPVMGAPDDTEDHWRLAQLRAQREVLIDACKTLEATGTDYLPTMVVLAILEAV